MVGKVFYESAVRISGVDYEELGLYISLNRTVEEIEGIGLRTVCPTRRSNRRPPEITASGIKSEKAKRFEPWLPPTAIPNERETTHAHGGSQNRNVGCDEQPYIHL